MISENDPFLHHLTNTKDLVDGFRNETVWSQKIINIMLLNSYNILLTYDKNSEYVDDSI